MNPESIQKLIDALEKNGGVVVEGIAANAAIRAWGDLILLPFIITLAVGLSFLAYKLWMKAKEADYDKEGRLATGAIVSTMFAAISGIAAVIGVCGIPEDIATIKNPKAAAIRILIDK